MLLSPKAQAESTVPRPTPPRALGHADHAETFRRLRGHFQLDTESFLETSVKAVCHILCPRSASGKDWASLREEVDPTFHDLWTVGLEKAGSWVTPRPCEYLTLHNGVRMLGHLLQVGQQPCQRSRQRSPEVGDCHNVRAKGSDLEVVVGTWSFMYQQEIRAMRGSGGHKP